MIKKVLMVLLGAALVLSMAGTVAADDKELTITTVVGDEYTLNIPSEISAIGENYAYAGNVSVTNIIIAKGATLTVSATSSDWALTNTTSGATLGFSMQYLTGQQKGSESLESATEVTDSSAIILTYTMSTAATGNDGAASDYTNIGFKRIGTPTIAGIYEGKMTFTVSIDKPSTDSSTSTA